MSCCPAGALPASYAEKGSSFTPAGETIDLGGGARMYATGDPRWKTAIVVMHDVFGLDGGHHRALCDALAAGGHYVVCPDFYEAGSIEPYYNRGAADEGKEWLKRFNWAWCSAILERVYAHLDGKGITSTGSIGFCWGAWAVAKACQDPGRVQAGVWCHPSCQVGRELYEGETEQELAQRVKSPTLILPSPQEAELYRNGELATIFEANAVANDMVYFHDQSHGWMTRGAGFLGKSWVDSGGRENLTSIVGVQRGVNLTLGWFAKHLHK